MRFLRTGLGIALLVAFGALVVLFGTTLAWVDRTTTPELTAEPPIDFGAMGIDAEQVTFEAADRRVARGWLLDPVGPRPPIILCHDLGASKASLINLAIRLREEGFTVLAFDFRGHGESGRARSTLGRDEKRDVVGAVGFIAERLGVKRVGVFGVGMGAHAAVLAAAERPEIKVLVLDGLYPDISYPLMDGLFDDWEFAGRHLGALPRAAYGVLNGFGAERDRAADVIDRLPGRDVLLLAPEKPVQLAEAMRRMYETIPDQIDVDGNLVMLPATHGQGLFGEELEEYQRRVTGFFLDRLRERPAPGETTTAHNVGG